MRKYKKRWKNNKKTGGFSRFKKVIDMAPETLNFPEKIESFLLIISLFYCKISNSYLKIKSSIFLVNMCFFC